VIERHHRSSFRGGRWFGISWASTLDQRLWVDDQGIRFTTADGMILHYTVPVPDEPVMPLNGPRWPLRWDGTHGGTMTVHQTDTGRTLHFRPLPGRNPTQLHLHAVTDRNDNRITLTYDPATGAPTELTHDAGYRVGIETTTGRITALRLLNHPDQPILLTYAHDQAGNLTQVTNSSGLPLTFTYDAHHRITSWTDRNNTWYRYTYDDHGRCIHTTGTDGILDYTYRYDPDTRTTHATNSLGHTTSYRFNDAYRLIAETDPLGNTTTRTWDHHNHLLTHTDPLGNTTHYTHDQAGNLTRVTHPDGTTVRAEYNDLGQPQRITTADSEEWRQTYDERGNCLTSTDPLGATTTFAYDGHGGLIALTDAVGGVQRYTLSAAGLAVAVTDAEGGTVRLERDPFGRVVAATDQNGAVTTFAWSVEGRLTEQVSPDGATRRWVYGPEGDLVEAHDPARGIHRTVTGHFDVPTARVAVDGSVTTFDYDTELRLTTVTNPQGDAWSYAYDPAGRLVRETDFNGRTTDYAYDDAGRLVERTNGAGQRISYVRDALGRIIEQRGDDIAPARMTYDACGRLIQAATDDVVLRYERDAVGRVTSESINGSAVTSVFDLLGRRVERRTPAGAVSTWSYTGNHQPAALDVLGRTVTFSYDPAGRETTRQVGDFLDVAQRWDAAGRVVARSASRPGAAPMIQRCFTYRPDGRLVEAVDRDAGPARLTLDDSGRVTAVDRPGGTETYAYDGAGNLSHAVAPTAVSDDTQGERLTSGTLLHRAGRCSYRYDEQGRVVRRTRRLLSGGRRTWTYGWDAQDRLTSVAAPDGEVFRYAYDPLGRRVAKRRYTPDGELTAEIRFVWDGSRLAEQHASATSTTWEYLPGTHQPIAQLQRTAPPEGGGEQAGVDAVFYAIVTDLVGAPTELVEESGDVAWRSATTAWGVPLDHPDSRADCPLRFPGQYHDPETGLSYNHLRYYDPETARYESPDPLGLAAAPNQYAYVANPYDEIDPLGLVPCTQLLEKLKPGEMYLYRAVQDGELRELLQTRRFANPAGIEVKYFSTTAEGAAAYARQAFRSWPAEGAYTLVRAVIHQDAINPASLIEHLADAGGGIDALALSTEELAHMGRVRILPFMPIP
jgi:RHS repeat-associated protein